MSAKKRHELNWSTIPTYEYVKDSLKFAYNVPYDERVRLDSHDGWRRQKSHFLLVWREDTEALITRFHALSLSSQIFLLGILNT